MYCKHLWNNLVLAPDGTYKSCCHMYSVGTYASGMQLDDMFNHIVLRNMRHTMEQGEWPVQCFKCKRVEDAGLMSLRQKMGDGDTTNVPQLSSVDIRTNTCNLACHICGPRNSSALIPITKQMRQELSLKSSAAVDSGLAITPNIKREVMAQVEEKMMNGQILTFNLIGGEPLLDSNTWNLLQRAHDDNLTGLSFHIITNMMVSQDRIEQLTELCLRLVANGNTISIKVSCDGYGDAVEFGRDGFIWEQFEKNMLILAACSHKVKIVVGYVFTIPAVESLPAFIEWMERCLPSNIKLLPSSYQAHEVDSIPAFGQNNLYLNDISFFTDEMLGGIVEDAIEGIEQSVCIPKAHKHNAIKLLRDTVGTQVGQFEFDEWVRVTRTRIKLNRNNDWLDRYAHKVPIFSILKDSNE